MKGKKHLISGIILLILLFVSIILLVIRNKDINEKNSMNTSKISELNNQINSLNNKILELENANKLEGLDSNRTCTFTETYMFLEVLEYKTQVPGIKFILLDTFQGSRPYILRVTDKQVKELKANVFYEITFTGKYSENPDRSDYEITSIVKTNKIGLDQIQESCK